jgi:biotin carboxylase
MHVNKRLLILGAGTGQLPAILRAVERGLFVITADYLPDNVGHRYSHQSINCSTVDKAGILAAAKELDIDGIVTIASDVATASVAHVANHLGLPGCSVRTAETMSNKGRFRAAQQEHGLHSPAFLIGQEFSQVEEGMARLHPPLMFKPVDASGSRGISRVDGVDRQACMDAFSQARRYSRSDTVCVEEFVEGVEVGGDGFLLDGRLRFAAITHKHKCGYIVTGHNLPTNISSEDQE